MTSLAPRMPHRSSWVILALCLACAEAADTVTLTNGDRLTGSIQKLENGTLTLKSPYSAEPLRIEWPSVADIATEDEFQLTFADGKETTGKLAPGGFVSPVREQVAAIRRVEAEPEPDAGWPRRMWQNTSVSADFDQNYSGLGNYNQFSLNSDLEYSGDRWEGSMQTRYFYYGANGSARSNYQAYGRLVAKRYLGGDSFFLFPYLFVGRQTTDDGGRGQVRQYGGGAGWTFRRGEPSEVSVFSGIVRSAVNGYAYSGDPEEERDRTDLHLDQPLSVAGVTWSQKFGKRAELTARLYAFKPITAGGHFAMATDSAVKVPFFGKTFFTVRVYDTPELAQRRLFSTKNLQVSSGIGIEF